MPKCLIITFVAPHIMLRAALKLPNLNWLDRPQLVAPHIMLRAALKQHELRQLREGTVGCTTYHAACGIETLKTATLRQQPSVAPHIMLRAALKQNDLRVEIDVFWVAPHIMLRAALKRSFEEGCL